MTVEVDTDLGVMRCRMCGQELQRPVGCKKWVLGVELAFADSHSACRKASEATPPENAICRFEPAVPVDFTSVLVTLREGKGAVITARDGNRIATIQAGKRKNGSGILLAIELPASLRVHRCNKAGAPEGESSGPR